MEQVMEVRPEVLKDHDARAQMIAQALTKGLGPTIKNEINELADEIAAAYRAGEINAEELQMAVFGDRGNRRQRRAVMKRVRQSAAKRKDKT